MTRPAVNLWHDRELASSVEAYLFMLRMELAGLAYPSRAASDLLLAGPLGARNEAAVRYRMRNISAVVTELGGPTLQAYTPAEQVGANVRVRIREFLASHPGFQALLAEPTAVGPMPGGEPREVALSALADLRARLEDLERRILGVGHNRPPRTLVEDGPDREDFRNALASVRRLEEEVAKPAPDAAVAEDHTRRLLDFGLKLALWAGERATKFTDVALKVLAPIVVAKVTGLMPALAEAGAAVLKVVGH